MVKHTSNVLFALLFSVAVPAAGCADASSSEGANESDLTGQSVVCKGGEFRARALDDRMTEKLQEYDVKLEPQTAMAVFLGTISATFTATVTDPSGKKRAIVVRPGSTDIAPTFANVSKEPATYHLKVERSGGHSGDSFTGMCMPVADGTLPSGIRDEAVCKVGSACTFTTASGAKKRDTCKGVFTNLSATRVGHCGD